MSWVRSGQADQSGGIGRFKYSRPSRLLSTQARRRAGLLLPGHGDSHVTTGGLPVTNSFAVNSEDQWMAQLVSKYRLWTVVCTRHARR